MSMANSITANLSIATENHQFGGQKVQPGQKLGNLGNLFLIFSLPSFRL